ncbi:hypothetical protein NDU88_010477 [Pleurodeles waltl]|uniref:TIL domain-containing protein n=1 Tax=Pleurodeles waltl TaxID=8319 RepID=A0AAV7PVV4_PLEWA|nr:hypothetical protein NDU88_010477 [Pleurodeles waltl]
MAKRSCLLFVLVVVLTTMLWIGKCDEECGKNMEYSKCGSSCPMTCDDVANLSGAKMCAAMCVPGCFCKTGFVLNDGKCIPKSNCHCPQNAEYRCLKCERTCEEVTGMGPPKACPKICILGCECKQGYALDSGKCIPQTKCRCQENAEFMQNGTCQRTCEGVPNKSSGLCTKVAGCYCKQGYALSGTKCIPQKECRCKENEKYSECNTACPLTCENYRKPPKVCIQMCVKGCACAGGYVKSASGACVRPEQCSRSS